MTSDAPARFIRLADWLWSGARELHTRSPDATRQAATLQAMQARFAERQGALRPRRSRWWLAGPGLCAGALLACFGLLSLAPPGDDGAVVARGSDFIVLVSAERWAAYQAAGSSTAWLVDADVPRERLALLGLPYDPSAAAEPVHAELLVQASGDLLAMRVLP